MPDAFFYEKFHHSIELCNSSSRRLFGELFPHMNRNSTKRRVKHKILGLGFDSTLVVVTCGGIKSSSGVKGVKYLVHSPECLKSMAKMSQFDKGPPELPNDGRCQSSVLKPPEGAQEVFEKVKGLS